MAKKLILYVDNDNLQLDAMAQRLEAKLDCLIIPAGTIEDGKRKIDEYSRKLDLVITDMHFGDEDKEGGLRIVEHASKLRAFIPVIVLTGKGNTENAVKSMELGAFSYVEKGFVDDATVKLLLYKASHAFKRRRLEQRIKKKEQENRSKSHRISRDLEKARTLQQAFLPKEPISHQGWEIQARYNPCDEVSGDFYYFSAHPTGVTSLLIGDAIGHGVPAALLAAMIRSAINTAGNPTPDADSVASNLMANISFLRPPFSATAFYASLDPNGWVRFFSAGHPAALLLRNDGSVHRLQSTGRLLTYLPSITSRGSMRVESIQVRKGERLLLYTDGIIEASNISGKEFGLTRLSTILKESNSLSQQGCILRLFSELNQHCRRAALDDQTVLIVDRKLAGNSGD